MDKGMVVVIKKTLTAFRLTILTFILPLRPLPPLLVPNLLLPVRNPETTSQMHHNTSLRRPVPMLRPRLTNNHIPHVNTPWLSAPITDPARAHLDFENLPVFVGVPVGPGGRGEEDVVKHYFCGVGG